MVRIPKGDASEERELVAAWAVFFEAEVGASAALAGLIFVGVSINMSRILSLPRLSERALQAIVVLLTVLLISALLLVPNQPDAAAGAEILVVGAAAWAINTRIDVVSLRVVEAKYRGHYALTALLDQCTLVPYLVGGALFALVGSVGLYCVVLGVMVAFVKAILDAWVLLVEINR